MFAPKKIIYTTAIKTLREVGYMDEENKKMVPPVYEDVLEPSQYPVYSQEEFDEWLPVIQTAYGQYGEVTVTEDDVPQKSLSVEDQLVELQKVNAQLEAGMAQIAMQTAINTLLQGGI